MVKEHVAGWIFSKALTFIGVSFFLIVLTVEYEKSPTDLISLILRDPFNSLSLFVMVLLFIISEIKLQEI